MEGGAGDWRRVPLISTSSSRFVLPSGRSRNSNEVAERTEQPRQSIRPATTSSSNTSNQPPPEEEDGRMSAFVQIQELSKLLECPVCYEIALPPVIMCTSGHNICSDCRKQCNRCPVCRSGFCEARNRLAESIVEKCSIACKYRSSGCDQVMNGSRMAVHVENECEFRPVYCRDCKVKVPYEEYINHLINIERLPKQVATECSTGFDIEEEDFTQSLGGLGQSWEPTWLYCHDLDFFCHLESVGNFWWIYVIGFAPDNVLQNFLCDILVWNREKKQEFRFHGPVHSYRKSGEDILASGQCLITSENSIRSILNEGGIDVVVCIVTANAYRAPTSRNTGQPIYSPLTLRPSADAQNQNQNHLAELLNALSTQEPDSPTGANDTRHSVSDVTQSDRAINHGNRHTGDVGATSISFPTGNANTAIAFSYSPTLPQSQPPPQPLPRTSSISQVSQAPADISGSRHRTSRADRDQQANRAPTRSRSLDGGRRRRHPRHNVHNNPS